MTSTTDQAPSSEQPRDSAGPRSFNGRTLGAWRLAWIALLIATPLALGLGPVDSLDLNRKTREFPPIRDLATLRVETYAAFTDALRDRLGGRRVARRGNAELSHLLNDDLSGMAIAGSPGWYFLNQSITEFARLDADPQKWRRAVGVLQRAVTGQNRQFRMIVAPAKTTLYSDRLKAPDKRFWLERAQPVEAWFTALMQRRPVAGFIDLNGSMKRFAQTSPEPIYEPLGTHWTDLGAINAVEAIVRSLDQELWQRARVVAVGKEVLEGDLARAEGLVRDFEFTDLAVELPGTVTAVVENRWVGDRARLVVYETRRSDTELAAERSDEVEPTKLLPPVMVIHDSFGIKLMELLSPFFERTVFVTYEAAFDDRVHRYLAQSGIVVFEIAERNLVETSGENPTRNWAQVSDLLDSAPRWAGVLENGIEDGAAALVSDHGGNR